MNFSDLVNSLVHDTIGSLALFRPELMLCATIVLMLLAASVPRDGADRRVLHRFGRRGGWPVVFGALAALEFDRVGHSARIVHRHAGLRFVHGLFPHAAAVFRRAVRGVHAYLRHSRSREDAADIYSLVLGATLGMCLMASANHLLMVFLGVEMASVPSYALAGLLKGRPQSSEAALKYAVYGAGAAGIMLYGISLLAGVLGSLPPADDGRATGRWHCNRAALSNTLHGAGAGRA